MKTKILLPVFLLLGMSGWGQTELIQNGNFSNLTTGWTTSGMWYVSGSFSCYSSPTAYAYVGNASGAAVNNANGNLSQNVTIPSNATSATLSYKVSINTDETTTTTTYDYIAVYFTDLSWNALTSTTSYSYGNLQGNAGSTACQTYQTHSFSVPSSLFGQTVKVVFHTYTDGAKLTKFRVDDVSLTYTSCNSPVANFSGNPTSGNAPLYVNFTDLSSNSPTSWNWSFPGGSPSSSTSQNPSNINYSSAGTYNVTLTAANGCGSNPKTINGYITVTNPPPAPDIDVNPTTLTLYKQNKMSSGTNLIPYGITNNDLLQDKNNGGLAARVIVPESVTENWRQNMFIKYPIILSSIDWSIYDSPVKNQKSCGSCYAFAAVGLLENLAIQAGLPTAATDLSEQYLVSCQPDGSCDGGWYFNSFDYIKDNGIVPEGCFNYTAENDFCFNQCLFPVLVVNFSSYTTYLWNNPTVADIKLALQEGPICIAMKIPIDFYNYSYGIYNYQSGGFSSQLHAVLVVGYDDNQQYFKVKNSWGSLRVFPHPLGENLDIFVLLTMM